MDIVERDEDTSQEETESEPSEPNEEWVKHMKLKMISKSREEIDKKVLKFYH